MFDQFFQQADQLKQRGVPYATAMVVRVEKPTSGKPGDKAIITIDGKLHGWVGGSCAQPTVIREAQKAMRSGESRLIRLSNDNDPSAVPDGMTILPMTCYSEGTLEIFIEPHLPQPQLIVVGSMPVAQALLKIGDAMGYRLVAVDPEKSGTDLSTAETVLDNLGDVMAQIRPDSYVVVASHGNYDEAALEHVLKAKPRYVGLVASKKRFASVLEYLQHQGFTDNDMSVLKAPAGIDIQATRADEIALSIMAEIVQIRRSQPLDVDWDKVIADISTAQTESTISGIAIDLVCGMEVDKATANITYDHNGETYYFCCKGCRLTFSKDPEQYISSPPAIAIDPICHMEVETANAQYTYDYEGETYYFCCAGCKLTFSKNPEQYIQQEQTVAIDPVCHMEVDIATAQYTTEHGGETYYFCCAGCKMSFEKDPQAYLESEMRS